MSKGQEGNGCCSLCLAGSQYLFPLPSLLATEVELMLWSLNLLFITVCTRQAREVFFPFSPLWPWDQKILFPFPPHISFVYTDIRSAGVTCHFEALVTWVACQSRLVFNVLLNSLPLWEVRGSYKYNPAFMMIIGHLFQSSDIQLFYKQLGLQWLGNLVAVLVAIHFSHIHTHMVGGV